MVSPSIPAELLQFLLRSRNMLVSTVDPDIGIVLTNCSTDLPTLLRGILLYHAFGTGHHTAVFTYQTYECYTVKQSLIYVHYNVRVSFLA